MYGSGIYPAVPPNPATPTHAASSTPVFSGQAGLSRPVVVHAATTMPATMPATAPGQAAQAHWPPDRRVTVVTQQPVAVLRSTLSASTGTGPTPAAPTVASPDKLPPHLPEDLSRRLDLAHEELARERLRSEELTAELSKARQVADDEVQSLRRQLLSREKELFEAAAARQRSASQTEALAEALRGKLLELEARLATPSQPSTPLYGGRDLLDGWRSSAKGLEHFGAVREEVPWHRWSEHAPNGYPRSGPGFLESRGAASARAEDLEAKAPLGMQRLGLSAPIAALDEEDWPPNPYRWPDQAGREERPLEAGEEAVREQCDSGSQAAPATASEEVSLDPSAHLAAEDPSRVDGDTPPAESHLWTKKRTLETGLAPRSSIP